MIEAGRAKKLRERLRTLEELAPFAPRGVADELSRMASDRGYVFPERRAIERLRIAIVGRHAPLREPAACAFPVLTQSESWLDGAILQAVVTADLRPGAAAAEEVFSDEGRMLELLARFSDARPLVIPSPLQASTRICELVGDSGGAAFALALEAARRGVAVPQDIAVSAALDTDASGALVLRPVSGCDQKRRILERERPGCRFFFLAQEGEEVGASATIELVPLEPGTMQALCDRLLPRAPAGQESLSQAVREAEGHFAGQRYPLARRGWRRLYLQLREELRGDAASLPQHRQRARWAIQALGRLGAIELHAGHPVLADLYFSAATARMRQAPDVPTTLVDEVLVSVASVHLDRLRPAAAESVLTPLVERWRALVAEAPEALESRQMLIACLGATRRLMLLKGEASVAVEVQEEILGLASTAERPRCLADLGECLRRAGRFGQAGEALALGRASLYRIPIESYRIQTEAFLAFYEGRLALDRGSEAPSLVYLDSIREALPPRSAAGWRLDQLSRLLRLRAGDRDAAGELIDQLARASGDFARWHATLGLLRGARITQSEGPRLRWAAAEALEALAACTAGYPALEAARAEYVGSIHAQHDAEWAERLHLRLCAY